MPLRWIALAMIVAGIAGVLSAEWLDPKSSFESGTFLVEIVLGIGGIICFVVRCVLMLGSFFVAARSRPA
jgi:hypothetical protein